MHRRALIFIDNQLFDFHPVEQNLSVSRDERFCSLAKHQVLLALQVQTRKGLIHFSRDRLAGKIFFEILPSPNISS